MTTLLRVPKSVPANILNDALSWPGVEPLGPILQGRLEEAARDLEYLDDFSFKQFDKGAQAALFWLNEQLKDDQKEAIGHLLVDFEKHQWEIWRAAEKYLPGEDDPVMTMKSCTLEIQPKPTERKPNDDHHKDHIQSLRVQ